MELNTGFKKTVVGVIPGDWTTQACARLVDSIAPIRYGVVQVGKHTDNGIPIVAIKYVKEIAYAPLHRTSVDLEKPYIGSRVKTGDVLISIKGTIGRVGIVPHGFDGNISRELARLRIQEKYSPAYIAHQLENGGTQERINRAVVGTTRLEFSVAALREFEIPLPPTKAEQEAIAEALSDADALIESLQQLLVKKRQIKQGTMQELLTGKKRLPGFSGEWEVKQLGAICDIAMGRTPPRLNAANWGTGYKWLSISDLKTKVVVESKEEITPLAAAEMQIIRTGTLLMSFKLSIGRLCFAGCDLYTNEAICSFNNPTANAEFLYYALGRTDFKLYGKQAVKGYTLNKESLKLVQLLLPTKAEQTAVATILSDMDTEITALESRLSKTRSIKQGMMQELLTGRIRLAKRRASVAEVESTSKMTKPHNWQFNEAVVISVLTKRFGDEQFPLARVRRTKLSYLLHRHVGEQTEGYLKKAAGPYDPRVRYGGPEKIAIKNGYVREHNNGNYRGFVAAANFSKAEDYFDTWYGRDGIRWLANFKRRKTEDLELLTTVDMACRDLVREGSKVELTAVKKLMHDDPEWKAKLDRELFSDENIVRAIGECQRLFGHSSPQ